MYLRFYIDPETGKPHIYNHETESIPFRLERRAGSKRGFKESSLTMRNNLKKKRWRKTKQPLRIKPKR